MKAVTEEELEKQIEAVSRNCYIVCDAATLRDIEAVFQEVLKTADIWTKRCARARWLFQHGLGFLIPLLCKGTAQELYEINKAHRQFLEELCGSKQAAEGET